MGNMSDDRKKKKQNVPTKVAHCVISGMVLASALAPFADGTYAPLAVEATSLTNYYDMNAAHPYYKSFQWAITNGYVSINTNAKVKGKKVVLVSPNAVLKEADALMGITKYFWRGDVTKTKSLNKKNWASVYYQVAQSKKLPTKSSYKSNSSPILTKGQLAVLLVSAHYGKPVSLDVAVQKLYQARVTSGNKVGNTYPKTKASFGVNDKVTKSTFVLWLYNYNMNKGKFGNLQSPNPIPPSYDDTEKVPEKYKGRIEVAGIYTHYGRTYQTRNQKEYDTAFNIIKTRVEQLKKQGWFTDPGDNTWLQALYMYYKEGRTAEEFKDNKYMYAVMQDAMTEPNIKYLIEKKGLTIEEVIQLIKMKELSFMLEIEAGAKDPLTGKPRSIYDSLVRKQYDCDTTANVYMAIADIMGYDALIIADATHAECYVKVRGEWLAGVQIMTDVLFKSLENKTGYLYTKPRTGLK